jgi:glycosyltransferase involved in cell wall biosynthesis
MKKLSIIIPVYNEEKTIHQVLEVVYNINLLQNVVKEIIVVNDASKDNSLKEIERFKHAGHNIQIIDKPINEGKGAAIHTGIRYASGDYTIIQDADLELNPSEINLVIEPVLLGKADVVYGSRFLQGKIKTQGLLSRWANWFLTKLSNLVFGIKITDMETCYKLVPTDVFKSLKLVEQRFGFEPEITAKLAKVKKLRWIEVPITYNPRNSEQGKKIGWKDGIRAVHCILKYGL